MAIKPDTNSDWKDKLMQIRSQLNDSLKSVPTDAKVAMPKQSFVTPNAGSMTTPTNPIQPGVAGTTQIDPNRNISNEQQNYAKGGTVKNKQSHKGSFNDYAKGADVKPEDSVTPPVTPAAVVNPPAPVAPKDPNEQDNDATPDAPTDNKAGVASPTHTSTETGGSSPGGASTGGVGSGIGGAGTGGAATGGASTGGAGTVTVTLSGDSGSNNSKKGGKAGKGSKAPVNINISNVGGTTKAGHVASGDGPGSSGTGGSGKGSGGGGGGAAPSEPSGMGPTDDTTSDSGDQHLAKGGCTHYSKGGTVRSVKHFADGDVAGDAISGNDPSSGGDTLHLPTIMAILKHALGVGGSSNSSSTDPSVQDAAKADPTDSSQEQSFQAGVDPTTPENNQPPLPPFGGGGNPVGGATGDFTPDQNPDNAGSGAPTAANPFPPKNPLPNAPPMSDAAKYQQLRDALTQQRNVQPVFNLAGGITDAVNAANRAGFGDRVALTDNAGDRQKASEAFQKQEGTDLDTSLAHDPTSDLSKQYQDTAKLLGAPASLVTGKSAADIAQTLPSIEKYMQNQTTVNGRLEAAKLRAQNAKDATDSKKEATDAKNVAAMQTTYSKDANVVKSQGTLDRLSAAIPLLKAGSLDNPTALQAVQTALTFASTGGQRVNEIEFKAFGGSQSAVNQLQQYAGKLMSGKTLTPSDQQHMAQIIQIYSDSAQKNLDQAGMRYAKQLSQRNKGKDEDNFQLITGSPYQATSVTPSTSTTPKSTGGWKVIR